MAVWSQSRQIESRIVVRHTFYPVNVVCGVAVAEGVNDCNGVAQVAVVWRVGIRIIQIIGIVLVDQRRSDSEDGFGIRRHATVRLFHGIVDDLEKVWASWPVVEVVNVSPTAVIVGIS